MSKRLQVLLEEQEFKELRQAARRQRMTVAEWVRQALRSARRRGPEQHADRKLAAVRAAARHNLPTADMAQMQAEIESGYLGAPRP